MHLFYSSPVYRAFVNFYHYRQPPGDDGQTIEQLLRLGSENFEARTLGCCAVHCHGEGEDGSASRHYWSWNIGGRNNVEYLKRSCWVFFVWMCSPQNDIAPCWSAVQVLTLWRGMCCVWILYSFITQWVSQQLTTHSKTANMRQLIPACALKVLHTSTTLL